MNTTWNALPPEEIDRLRSEAARLLDFGRASVHPAGGFGRLDDDGRLDVAQPAETWVTARMTHCYGLALLRGDASAQPLLEHGVRGLLGPLRDGEHGGWHSVAGKPDGTKEGYAHVFVVLAAVTAYAAGHPEADRLLAEALAVVDERWWREDDGMIVDAWSADWTVLDPYRGANANMHAVEAFLAVAEVTGEARWGERALRVIERVVHSVARSADWRLPEHFDPAWRPQRDYNVDVPGHPFRPYGVTIGHLFEWSRLALHARTLLGEAAAGWLLDDARGLYAAAVSRGWEVDGAAGFVYTTDFGDRPIVRHRMHWVAAEAIAAAWTLHRETGDGEPLDHYRSWWEYVDSYVIDRERGSWLHELDPANRPAATVWAGKPDIYHAYQATLLPLLPAAASFAGAARGSR